jgi:hypothetical protein
VRFMLLCAVTVTGLVPTGALADITCNASQPLAQQNRTHMKYRNPPQHNPGVTPATVAQVLAESPAAGISQPGFRRKDSSLDSRNARSDTQR